MKSKVLLVAVCVTLGLVFVAPYSVLSDFYVIPVVKGNVGPPAPIPKTGQTTFYATGDDGNLQVGMSWPTPRFIDNGDGTVTDKLTDLIWLKDANCSSFFSGDGTGSNPRNWSDALTAANSLAMGYCGLSDGSISGDWRLPNVRELQSLIHYGIFWPSVPNTAGTGQWSEGDPFIGVQSSSYWSSTTYSYSYPSYAWYVNLQSGNVNHNSKDLSNSYVWPVRADN